MNVLIIGFGKMGQTRAKHLEQIDVVDKIYVCDKESALNKKDLENRIFLESLMKLFRQTRLMLFLFAL